MIKYAGYYITFQEVPNEVSLVLTITGCPRRCDGCHSPWLRDPELGNDLIEDLPGLLDKYQDAVTCVCFMGEGTDEEAFEACVHMVWMKHLKVCLYSGVDSFEDLPYIARFLNYIKLGHYNKLRGGLHIPGTNQRFYMNPCAINGTRTLHRWCPAGLVDLTEEFQKKYRLDEYF